MVEKISGNRPKDRVPRAIGAQLGLAVRTRPSCSAEDRIVQVDGAEIQLRNYRPTEASAMLTLYTNGRVARGVTPAALPEDLQRLEAAYTDAQGCRFWVAEYRGELVAMLGLLKESTDVGRLNRFRILPRYRETELPSQLIRSALQRAREQGLLKIIWDTDMPGPHAAAIFAPCGYRLSRHHVREGRLRIEFYLDLYARAACEEESRSS